MLKRLTNRERLNILGINSGTSADGIDLALIACARRGQRLQIKYIDGCTQPYGKETKRELERIIGGPALNPEALARADMAYGHYLAKAAADFISVNGHHVDLIASHGQTIGHYPRKEKVFGIKTSATFQIGDGNAMAVGTGLPVVSGFRMADIAVGGEGAPLTPFVNQMLFGGDRASRVIVNIGGIANYSYHPAGGDLRHIRGGDCGPGNRLSDIATELLFGRKYDKDGELARKGQPVPEIVETITKASRYPTVSTGRERFDELLLARLVHAVRRKRAGYHDLMASIVEATAKSIYGSIKRYMRDEHLDGVYLTGGGRRNIYLVERLMKFISPVRLWPIEVLGYDGDLLEAISFAVLGGCFVFGIPSTLPGVSGGREGGIAGRLSYPVK